MWGNKELTNYANNLISDMNVILYLILHTASTSNERGQTKIRIKILYYTLRSWLIAA
jgi:hypothetical protein